MDTEKYFLPYQIRWLEDQSRIKIWEKSRRIGASYTQSFEDVLDCAEGKVRDIWYTATDETAAREYIDYAGFWARVLNIGYEFIGEKLIDDSDIMVLQVRMRNGCAINALTSNPTQLRSKGGKVVIDEFAHHKNPAALWKAARPVIIWGFPLRIISTHNGQNSLFNKFISAIRAGELPWSHHRVDIFRAVDEGLVDRILGHPASLEERSAWLAQERKNCFDEVTWLEEYCCVPAEEKSAYFSYELISMCESDDLHLAYDFSQGDFYLGMDIGRKHDLSVIWVVQREGKILTTRLVKEFVKTPFHVQEEYLYSLLSHQNIRRAAIDATGIGMQLVEGAQQMFGKSRVEAVTFTNQIKEMLATRVHIAFENRTIRIPSSHEIREDIHSLKRIVTPAGHIRYDAEGGDSHADRFWALALAIYAADQPSSEITVASRRPREIHAILRGY